MTLRILIVDEDARSREQLEILLGAEGFQVTGAPAYAGAVQELGVSPFDVLFCDEGLAGPEGPAPWTRLARRVRGARVVLLGAGGRSALCLAALAHGALECLQKPFEAADVRLLAARLRDHGRLHRARSLLQREVERTVGDHPLVAASPAMIALLEQVERVAAYRAPILLRGQRGTGKAILARAIHAQSQRRGEAFAWVRCTPGCEAALEEELFGHAPAALASSDRVRPGLLLEAHGGTVLFDELGALSQPLQERLLMLLREETIQPMGSSKAQPVDLRVVVATTADPDELQAAGRLLPELGRRLSQVQLEVPLLRDRREDIALLADHFLRSAATRLDRPARSLAEDALQRLIAYDWPGNVRELENVIEGAVLSSCRERLTLRDLPSRIVSDASRDALTRPGELSLRRARRLFEADLIRRALAQTGGNRTRAARLLEISHRALLYKLKAYGLRSSDS